MPLIDTIQKEVIFEEAAKLGIEGSQILSIGQLFTKILGVSDIGSTTYGSPLAPLYKAINNEPISIDKINSFFSGLVRDIKVIDLANTELENDLANLGLETWARIELLKNRANNITAIASQQANILANNSSWNYVENFNSTDYVDMLQTTAWIDTSLGSVFLPTDSNSQIIKPTDFTITELTSSVSLLGSNPNMALDGLVDTNFRAQFLDNSNVSFTVQFPKTSVTAITIDPLGFGIDIEIKLNDGTSYISAIKDIIYSKTTFVVSVKNCSAAKIIFSSATSVYPKVAGIKDLTFYISTPINTAALYTKLLKSTTPFTEISVNLDAQIPSTTSINSYVTFSSGGLWTPLDNNSWTSIQSVATQNIPLSLGSTYSDPVFRNLYGVPIANSTTSLPSLKTGGKLSVGNNQCEVLAFQQDWTSGTIPKLLTPQDFVGRKNLKAWTNVPSIPVNTTQTACQNKNQTDLYNNSSIARGGNALAFQRSIGSDFNQLVVVPMQGVSGFALQPGYNYKLKCLIYSTTQFSFDSGVITFLQGYRQAGRRSYRDINKSYGSVSLYINNEPIIGSTQPYTLYDDNTIEVGGDPGTPFGFTLLAGWNTVEICINIVNPVYYGADGFDNGYYLQIGLYPCLLDTLFLNSPKYPITECLGSGSYSPVSQFDLIWNLVKDPSYWSWSDDSNYIMFNTNSVRPVDGYFSGTLPNCLLSYKGIGTAAVQDMYLKFVLEKDSSSLAGPLLSGYNLMVR
jgi:hypothetical protein